MATTVGGWENTTLVGSECFALLFDYHSLFIAVGAGVAILRIGVGNCSKNTKIPLTIIMFEIDK